MKLNGIKNIDNEDIEMMRITTVDEKILEKNKLHVPSSPLKYLDMEKSLNAINDAPCA